MRISITDLENRIKYLNEITEGGFTLESAYGAYRLASHNGSVNVFHLMSKKELWNMIGAFIQGLNYAGL